MQPGGKSRFQTDANIFDFASLAPVSFALLDFDLYRVTKNCLPQLYEQLSPGGVIVVDDCDTGGTRWDGSAQAYREFVREQGLTELIVHGKLGVVKKPY
ncbi:MAG: TylF/MycF/NovP-related O-methyltransferase [Planctomycetota bacterium]